MQIAFAVVVKFVRCWCRETAMAEVRRVEEKRRSGLTLHARLGRQDKAGFPAAGTSFLSVCLHVVLGRSPTFPSRRASGAFADYYSLSMLRGPSPATYGESEMAVSSLAQVFLRCITRTAFPVSRDHVRLPIVVSWRATKTTFVSAPARAAIAAAGKKPRAESARRGDARPASSVKSIGRSGALAAIRTGTPAPGREATGSTRGGGALQRR